MSDMPQPATIIDGRYRVLSRVGSGGMADVLCAEDLQLGRKVAVKLLHRRFAQDAEFVERFRREASSAAGLQHPNVVAVYDRGRWDDTYYIAMEYLEGRTLKKVVQDEGPLAPDRAIDLTIQVLKAARFAHRRGVIHRDLKPHNVIVDDSGPPPRAKVTDFGIAKAGASDMTQTGSIMGTAQYLSPEQAQGQAVSAASDLYSIGIILYELLTGRVPFEGESAVTIALKQIGETPAPPTVHNPSISPELEAVVLHALRKDPAERFADADAFIAALSAAAGEGSRAAGQVTGPFPAIGATQVLAGAATGTVHPVVAIPPPDAYRAQPAVYPAPLEPAPERDGRRTWWWVGGLAALLLAAAAVGGYLLLAADHKLTVPDIVRLQESDAQLALRRKGFSTNTTTRDSPTQPSGTVIAQDPAAGSRAEKGSTITIVVSDGPGTADIPDLHDAARSAAHRRLRALGFPYVDEYQSSPDVKHNHVIETRPPAGTSSVNKGTRVTVVLSSGRQRIEMPTVTGLSRSDAETILQGNGLKVQAKEQESAARDPGTVLAQSVAPGDQVAQGATVVITIAKAPASVGVPDVTGRSEGTASTRLEAAGFRPVAKDQPVGDRTQDGRVLTQSPTGKARRGAAVTITVGRYDPTLDPATQTTPTTTTPPAPPPATTVP